MSVTNVRTNGPWINPGLIQFNLNEWQLPQIKFNTLKWHELIVIIRINSNWKEFQKKKLDRINEIGLNQAKLTKNYPEINNELIKIGQNLYSNYSNFSSN